MNYVHSEHPNSPRALADMFENTTVIAMQDFFKLLILHDRSALLLSGICAGVIYIFLARLSLLVDGIFLHGLFHICEATVCIPRKGIVHL